MFLGYIMLLLLLLLLLMMMMLLLQLSTDLSLYVSKLN